MALGHVHHHVGVLASAVRNRVHGAAAATARTVSSVAKGVDRGLEIAGKVDRVVSAVTPVYNRALHPALHASGYGDIANSIKGGLSTYESIRRSIR